MLMLLPKRFIRLLSPLLKVRNSIIFICLTPNPKGEHLKIIELRNTPFGGKGVKNFPEQTRYLNIVTSYL
jgi:hypothetical protein